MEEVYYGLLITILGALISLIKDWKSKKTEGYFKSNILGILGLTLVLVGGVKTCTFSKKTLREKKSSDRLASIRQDTIIKQGKNIVDLNKQLSNSVETQLDTTIRVLNYSKKLIETQESLTRLQNENNLLQSDLYSQVVGGDKIDKSFTIPIVVSKKDYLPALAMFSDNNWKKANNFARFFSSFLSWSLTSFCVSSYASIDLIQACLLEESAF